MQSGIFELFLYNCRFFKRLLWFIKLLPVPTYLLYCNISPVQVVQCDVMCGLEARLCGQVDLLVCNPPYVATEDAEVGGRDLSAAWAGGQAGLAVTE